MHKRVRLLEATGVVRGYSIRLDHARAGLPLTALVVFKMDLGAGWDATVADLRRLRQVEHCALTTGQTDGFMLVRTSGVAGLREVLRGINLLDGIRETETTVVLEDVFERVVLPTGAGSSV